MAPHETAHHQHAPRATAAQQRHRAAAARLVAVTAGALLLGLLVAVAWPVVQRTTFHANAALGWVVVQAVTDGTVLVVPDVDPGAPAFPLPGLDEPLPVEGDRIAVRYDPDDLTRAVPTTSSVWTPLLVAGAALVPVLAIVTTAAAVRARRPLSPPR